MKIDRDEGVGLSSSTEMLFSDIMILYLWFMIIYV